MPDPRQGNVSSQNNVGVVGKRVILCTLNCANKIILARNEDYLAMNNEI